MSTKRCAYRNCNSISSASNPSPLTFFAFPKHPSRYQLWMKLGGCREDGSFSQRYFCSKHFDESKYIAHNQRRKQLLNSAVPWPYDQSEQREIINQEVDYQCVASSIEDNDGGDNDSIDRLHVDSVSVEVTNANITDSIEEELQAFEYNVDENNDFTIAMSTEKKSNKRKLDHLESSAHETDAGPSSTIKESVEKALKVEPFYENNTTESRTLTTFIYKGEEYIQMRKDDYENEKLALIQKVKFYEDILRNMKHLMDDVKF